MDKKVKNLSVMCSILQILGLFLIIGAKSLPNFVWVIIAICGFAAVVNYFLINDEGEGLRILKSVAAVAGGGLIFLSMFKV
jgi:hypothetical protein